MRKDISLKVIGLRFIEAHCAHGEALKQREKHNNEWKMKRKTINVCAANLEERGRVRERARI